MDKNKGQRKCKSCGEPEMVGLPDSGDFGWFDDAEGKTWCMRCGSNPLRAPKRQKVSA